MKRREVLSALASVTALTAAPALLRGQGRSKPIRFESYGSGPTLILGPPMTSASARGAEALQAVRNGYLGGLTNHYRVVLMDYPSGDENAESFTPDRVASDILGVADSAGADRFAWYGFSWGGVVGLQLAARTTRLTALICGGWPPIGAPYATTLAASEALAAKIPEALLMVTYYRDLQNWPEREIVSQLAVPRMTFAGSLDTIAFERETIAIGPVIARHREELGRMGWTVKIVEGFGHELFNRPDVVTPLIRSFLDPVLLL
jgi:pimeloyl-ACP methyl ester carboxylesterase